MTAVQPTQATFTPAPAEPALAAAIGCWTELRDHLERRSRELAQEVRSYPTPIARCDEQLPWLIEQRDRVNRALREMAPAEAAPGEARAWLAGAERFLARSEPSRDDELETALRARLHSAVADARERLARGEA